MKIIITLIALTFFNCTYAQYKLEIIPSDSKYSKMQIDCIDNAECDSKLLKWIDKQKFFNGEWNDDAIGSIVSKVESDIENNNITKYFQPNNFTVNLVDISTEIADRALDKAIADKIACGSQSIKFIGKNNVKKNLTKAQIRQMVKTYSDIFDLLKAGAIDTALEDIQAINADGTIVTEQDKADILAFINGCE